MTAVYLRRFGMLLLLCPTLLLAQAAPFPTYPIQAPAGPPPPNFDRTLRSQSEWSFDRWPPSSFANIGPFNGRQNVLELGLTQAFALPNRPPAYQTTFYNTQGRRIALGTRPPNSSFVGSLWLPSSWLSSDPGSAQLNRRSDLWGVLMPGATGLTCDFEACNAFAVIGFTNADPVNPTTNGGSARFRVFDSQLPGDGWFNVPSATVPLVGDSWNNLCITWTGPTIEYRINDVLVYTDSTVVPDVPAGPLTNFSEAIVQGYNFGSDYAIRWSHLASGVGDCRSVTTVFQGSVPVAVPSLGAGALALMVGLLLALGALTLRSEH